MLSHPTRCKDLLQNITSRGITPQVIILKQMAWRRHLIKHWVKYSRRRLQRIEEIDMIAYLKLCGRIVLPCVPQCKPPHIPWSMGVKLFCLLKCSYPHYGSPFMRKLPTMNKFDSDFKTSMPWKKVAFKLSRIELYHQNMVRADDKLVKQRVFRKGELVLVLRCLIIITHKTRGKFEPKWE
jgi:hypothetical protein